MGLSRTFDSGVASPQYQRRETSRSELRASWKNCRPTTLELPKSPVQQADRALRCSVYAHDSAVTAKSTCSAEHAAKRFETDQTPTISAFERLAARKATSNDCALSDRRWLAETLLGKLPVCSLLCRFLAVCGP